MPPNLTQAFAVLERAAVAGERCPTRDFIDSAATSALARAGRIKVAISGRNWRTVTILTGPHAGKTTKCDPRGGHVYQTIGITSEWTPLPASQISRSDRVRRETSEARRNSSVAHRNLYRSDFQPT